MTFRCSNEIRQGGQVSPLLYNIYIYTHTHRWPKPSPKSAMYRRCPDKFTELCGSYLLENGTSDTFGAMSRICWTSWHCLQDDNITKTVRMLVRPQQSLGRYSTRVRPGNEELSFGDEFGYVGHDMTVEMIKILKNNSGDKMLVKKFWFDTPTEAKNPIVEVILLPNLW